MSFPYVDKLFQGNIQVDGRTFKADDLIYNLHYAFENELFNRNATVLWRTNSGPGSYTQVNFLNNEFPYHVIDSRKGYKISVVDVQDGGPFGIVTSPFRIETAGFIYGHTSNPGSGITLQAKAPGTNYREVWVGYYGRSGERPLVALGSIANHLIEIQTRFWAMSRLSVNHPWFIHYGDPRFNRGEAISLKYVGDIDRTFNWLTSIDEPQHFVLPLAYYFIYMEQSEYVSVYVYLPPEMVFVDGGEIGLFINGVCFGAAVIQGSVVQINAYIVDLDIDFETAIVEFHFHEYGPRSSDDLVVSEFKVYDHSTNTFVSSTIDLSSDQMFYMVSLRDEIEIPESVAYVTGLEGNFPNPFNPSTTITFSLSSGEGRGDGQVRLNVYNVRGQLVRTLLDGSTEFGAGVHSVVWNGDDDYGRSMASGIYFYRLETSEFSETRRMLLMK